MLAAGALIIGIGNVALSFVHSLPELYGVMAWLGPGQAAIGSVAASALVLRLFERRRSIAIGILNGGDNLITSGIYSAAAALAGVVGMARDVARSAPPISCSRRSCCWCCARADGRDAAAVRGADPPARRALGRSRACGSCA